MAAWNKQLNPNEFLTVLVNGFKYMATYADQLSGLKGLADQFRIDGGQYRDTTVFTDIGEIPTRRMNWNNTNELKPEARIRTKQQAIVTNKSRQVGLYTLPYLMKRTWMSPDAFDQFYSTIKKNVTEAKRLYEENLIKVAIGNITPSTATATKTVALPQNADPLIQNRLEVMTISKAVADAEIDIGDTLDTYNANGFVKAFNPSDLRIFYTSDYYTKMTHTDTPLFYEKEGLVKVGGYIPSRFAGGIALGATTADGTTHRSCDEYFIPVDSTGKYAAAGTIYKHVYPGYLLPEGTPIVDKNGTDVVTQKDVSLPDDESSYLGDVCTKARAYKQNSKLIAIIMHKDALKFASSFETMTDKFIAINSSNNTWLTWLFANPVEMDAYPIVTISAE